MKKISLSDGTYARLNRHRLPGERFRRSIDRLLELQANAALEFPVRVPKANGLTEEWRVEIEADREDTRTAE